MSAPEQQQNEEGEDAPQKKMTFTQQMTHCFHRHPRQPKPTIYDSWGSYEKEPGTRCNLMCKTNDGELISHPEKFSEMNTVWRMFENGLKLSPKGNCLGWRDDKVYKWWSYSEVADRIRDLARALASHGVQRQEKVGIYSMTRPDWIVTALALTSRSLIIVPLYDTLGHDSCTYIINQVNMSVLFIDTPTAARKILSISDTIPCLKTIILLLSEPDEELSKMSQDSHVKLITLEEFIGKSNKTEDDRKDEQKDENSEKPTEEVTSGEKDGDQEDEAKNEDSKTDEAAEEEKATEDQKDDDAAASSGEKEAEQPPVESAEKEDDASAFDPPNPEDTYIIMFTSGTTGMPKGVMLLQQSVTANILSIDSLFWPEMGPGLPFTKNEVLLSYLPLAHIYGMLCSVWILFKGASIGFFSGNILKLTEDAGILKPTIVPMVPRLMNKVYAVVLGELEKSKTKSKLFWLAYSKKRDAMIKGVVTKSSIWDKIVFKKLQAKFGGRVGFMAVGSAPISKEVLEFWRIVFGCFIVEGYGQTECSAGATLAVGPTGGNVGHPLPCNYIKLADVPDCGYIVSESGRGEVCIKGMNVMVEYFDQPEKTEEALDADGWLHTGDIGEFQADGSLKIVDRKKHIFKLAQGEYIAPEKVENTYLLCPKIAQIFVDGSSLESYVVAVVVPEPTMMTAYATEHSIDEKELMTNSDFKKMLFDAMVAIGKEQKLNSLEQVKNIHLTNEAFSVENGLITPTLKNKRPELRKRFKDEIDALYKAGPLSGGGGGGGDSKAT